MAIRSLVGLYGVLLKLLYNELHGMFLVLSHSFQILLRQLSTMPGIYK